MFSRLPTQNRNRLESLEKTVRQLLDRTEAHERELRAMAVDQLNMWDKVKTAVGRVYARDRGSKGDTNGDKGPAAVDDINEKIRQGIPL